MQVFSLKKYLLLQQNLGFPFKQDHMITHLYFTFRRNLHTPHLHPVIHLAFPFTSGCCVNEVDLLAQSRHSKWLSVLTLAFVRFILQGFPHIFNYTKHSFRKAVLWEALHGSWNSSLGVFRVFRLVLYFKELIYLLEGKFQMR